MIMHPEVFGGESRIFPDSVPTPQDQILIYRLAAGWLDGWVAPNRQVARLNGSAIPSRQRWSIIAKGAGH